MRTFLIDPTARTVKVHDLPDGELKSLYTAMDCQFVETIPLGSGYTLWIDEEGLLHPTDFFVLHNRGEPFNILSGKAIVTKDCAGDIQGLPEGFTPDHMRPMIAFVPEANKEAFALIAEEVLDSCGMVHDLAELEAKRTENTERMKRAYALCTQ